MIARTWHGRVPARLSEQYHAFLVAVAFPDYRATPGHRGILAQQWTEGEVSHFLLTTLWDSFEAIQLFAGEQFQRARYYPEDDGFLLEKEPTVTHTRVLLAELSG